MRQILMGVSLRAMVLLSAFVLAVALSSMIRHRKASNLEQPCAQMPTSNGLELPCSNADYSLLPTLTYCDLLAAPEQYENKLVLLSIDYVRMRIGTIRRADICKPVSTSFRLKIVAGATDSATQGLMNAWNAGLLPRGNVFIVAGRFRKDSTQSGDDSQNYQLELLAIKSVVFPD